MAIVVGMWLCSFVMEVFDCDDNVMVLNMMIMIIFEKEREKRKREIDEGCSIFC